MSELKNYDSWKTTPPDDGPHCPKCDGPLDVDTYFQEEECLDCGYSNGVDWDVVRDMRDGF